MNSSVTTKQPGSVISNAQYAKALLDRLKRRLQGFLVRNGQGQIVGTVQDLTLDPSDADGYFTLIVSQADAKEDRVFTLSSRSLQRIDIPNHVLFAKINEVPYPYHELPTKSSSELTHPSATAGPISAQVGTSSHESKTSASTAVTLVGNPTIAPPTRSNAGEPLEPTPLADTSALPQTVREEVVRLLEEKLDINRSKRKAGEVVIRKAVETRIVEVPVRWEKLIIEQVGAETKQLAEVDLGQGAVLGVELAHPNDVTQHPTAKGELVSLEAGRAVLETIASTVRHRCKLIKVDIYLRYWDIQKTHLEFTSPRVASHVLDAIAKSLHHRCVQVNIEILLDSWDIQKTYQDWLNKYRKP